LTEAAGKNGACLLANFQFNWFNRISAGFPIHLSPFGQFVVLIVLIQYGSYGRRATSTLIYLFDLTNGICLGMSERKRPLPGNFPSQGRSAGWGLENQE